MTGILKKTGRLLSSLKLTVFILTALILITIPATLIIQGQPPAFYLSRYPGTIGRLILALGYDSFYSSNLFILTVGVFWLNLLSCTVRRFTRQIRKKTNKRFGPDILHTGLLILIIGGLVTAAGRQEGTVFLREGDSMLLPEGGYLNLIEFEFNRYPDGRPQSWISEITVSTEPGGEGEYHEIAVNRPLRVEGLVIYQASFRTGKTVGSYETGLMVTRDPGKKTVLISFIIIGIGLVLTFLQKKRE